jgi:hypothetical protein
MGEMGNNGKEKNVCVCVCIIASSSFAFFSSQGRLRSCFFVEHIIGIIG